MEPDISRWSSTSANGTHADPAASAPGAKQRAEQQETRLSHSFDPALKVGEERRAEQESREAEKQRSRRADEQTSRRAEEQRSRRAEEQYLTWPLATTGPGWARAK